MSYLHPTRLHFAGRFRADVSTVNNDPQHFDNEHFSSNFQLPSAAGAPNGSWQPAGTGAWRLLECEVTRACRADGMAALTPAEDAVVGAAVAESADRASAKIVDLDPDQQGVSMIFGLTVRVVDGRGRLLLQGNFEPAAFFDLRSHRSSGGGGDAGRSAYFQSILTDVVWGDLAASPCLTEMKQRTAAQKLSIRFITDGYATGGPRRGYGRLVGTIGPYLDDEPHTFVAGRHLRVQTAAPPADRALEYAYVDSRVDTGRRKILVDVGNALKVDSSGNFSNLGELTLVTGSGTPIGAVNYNNPDDYARTAGIYELPQGRELTDAELSAIATTPLRLMLKPQGATAASVFAAENVDGVYVRAEKFVFRLDHDASAVTDLVVTRFGAPFANATPKIAMTPLSNLENLPVPEITTAAKTDAKGRAKLQITAVELENPRGFIDGMVYAIICWIEESAVDFGVLLNAESNFISLLMFNPVAAVADPGWDDVRQIFKQYSDLYPRPHGPDRYAPFDGLPPSRPVVNLEDYVRVAGFAHRILAALERPIDHPSHMPVTRDLSDGKRALLLKWLRNVGADGKPKRTGSPALALEAAAAKPARKPPARFAANAPLRGKPIRHEGPPRT
jgi:hypothetical protein